MESIACEASRSELGRERPSNLRHFRARARKGRKIMRSAFLKGFVFSTLAVGVALASTDAGAAAGSTSFSATECVNSEYNSSYKHVLEDGQVVNRTAYSLIDYCPVVSDTAAAYAKSASGLWVSGWSTASNSIIASACRTSISGGAGSCGSASYSSGSGSQSVSVSDRSTWAAGGGYDGYYLLVTFGPNAALFAYSFYHP